MDNYEALVLKKQGSIDEIQTKGNECFKFFKIYKHKWLIILCSIFSLGGGIMPLMMIWVMSQTVTSFINPDKGYYDSMVDFILEFIYLLLAMVVLMGLSYGTRGIANPACLHDIRSAIFSNLLRQEMSYFDEVSSGVLISRISEDVTFALDTYITKVQDSLIFAGQILSGLILSLVIEWRLGLIVLAIYPICALIYGVGEYYASKLWLEFRDSSSKAVSKAEEVITQFRTVKSFNNELYEAMSYSKNLKKDHEIIKRSSTVHAIKNFFMELVIWGIIPVMMWYGSHIIVYKPYYNLEFGNLFVLVSCATFCSMGISMLFSLIDDFRKANLSGAKIVQLIEKRPKLDLNKGEYPKKNVVGKIEFKDVCFQYSSRDALVLDHLSFTINPGETVAFVGESGCGKSTTLQLIQHFYEASTGQILVDGKDITQLSSVYLRSQIGVVPQNPTLFSLSVLDNIRFSNPEASVEETMNAAKVGNAHNFIVELPDSYNTMVQQSSLSGGQKQRICISRAILANTPILLLDEATASLDAESEELVRQSIHSFRENKTVIIVAHRLSTIKEVDKIFVFKEGKIVESGKHDELLQRGGVYTDLVNFQLQ